MTPVHQGKAVRIVLRTLILFISFLFTMSISAQTRDHLTDAETDLIRYWQELDKRTEVFIKAADRRFAIINGAAQPPMKKAMKDEPDWGEAPKGTRTQLLGDIAGILDEAITNIDNAATHNSKNPLVTRALRKLNNAANGYTQQLISLKTKTTDADEIAAIERVYDEAKEILDASGHLPAGAVEDEPPDKKDKKKKPM
ncbi:MAG TPA: hypothetical protein VHP99_11455 [Pyrinomonadaceae bacterium]|jgi:hypothetical protein|nr:hypothetical protein [Pyrinomonadaceae bacterium]